MNQTQPSVNWATVSQRMEDRRSAASNYRLARSSEQEIRTRRLSAWRARLRQRVIAGRDSLGHSLIDLGERVSVHDPKSLGQV